MSTLYLAIIPTDEYDLREKFQTEVSEDTKVEWYSYAGPVKSIEWHAGDVLIVSDLVMPDRGEAVEVFHRAHKSGARIIYVGIGTGDTEEWKRVLVMNGVYDFVFFSGDEIDLKPIKDLLQSPKTASDVSAYFPESLRPPTEELILVETVTKETKADDMEPAETVETDEHVESRGMKNRLKRLRWGRPEKSAASVHVVQPRVIAVVGIVPRAGVSTVTLLLAKLFANRLSSNAGGVVGIVEYPRQWPRMWEYFQLDERLKAERYRHWTQDGVGQSVDVDGISLVPLPPGHHHLDGKNAEQEMVRYVYRQMRGSITILDCGRSVDNELLFSMVDRVVCVIDCDPTYLSVDELGKQYEYLTERYGDKLTTVLNKSTKYAQFSRDLFEKPVRLPYLSSELVQQALWSGKFIDVALFEKEVAELERRLVDPLLPPSVATLLHEHERYKVAATRDPLTGCLNRKGLDEWLAARGKRSTDDSGFVLVLLDLDYFKQLNDTKGHAMGDEALKAISSAFQQALRSSDVISRFGGDEFIVILENANRSGIRKQLEELKARLPLKQYDLDMTMGVAYCPEHGKTLEQLKEYADARMYDGKRAGKGVIVLPESVSI